MSVLAANRVQAVLRNGGSTRLDDTVPAKFQSGNAVLTRNINPIGHTRLPRYARDKLGVIDCDHGVFIFPDIHAATGEKIGQHLYSVCFTSTELWGEDATHPGDLVYIDLFESYLKTNE